MSMTPYTGETLTIANIGTTPQERAMETSEFKMAFSKDFHEFVEWFNETHNGEINAHMAEYATNAIKKDGSVAMTSSLKFASAKGIATLTENATSFLDFDCLGLTTAGAYIRVFRNTNTTGIKRIDIHNGDGTSGIRMQILNGEINVLNGNYLKITSGSGSPEGVLSANAGSLYLRTDAGELYVKKTGTGNTGWTMMYNPTNITVSTSAPGSALAEGFQHQVY